MRSAFAALFALLCRRRRADRGLDPGAGGAVIGPCRRAFRCRRAKSAHGDKTLPAVRRPYFDRLDIDHHVAAAQPALAAPGFARPPRQRIEAADGVAMGAVGRDIEKQAGAGRVGVEQISALADGQRRFAQPGQHAGRKVAARRIGGPMTAPPAAAPRSGVEHAHRQQPPASARVPGALAGQIGIRAADKQAQPFNPPAIFRQCPRQPRQIGQSRLLGNVHSGLRLREILCLPKRQGFPIGPGKAPAAGIPQPDRARTVPVCRRVGHDIKNRSAAAGHARPIPNAEGVPAFDCPGVPPRRNA